MKKIKAGAYRGIPFSIRLMLLILATSILPILVLQMLSYHTISCTVTENTQRACWNNNAADAQAITLLLERYQMVAEKVSTNQEILDNIAYLNVWDSRNYRLAGIRIRAELYDIVSPYSDILGICVVTQQGEMLFQDKITQSAVESYIVPDKNLWYTSAFRQTISTHEFLYLPTEQRSGAYGQRQLMVMSQSIPDYTGVSEDNIGVVLLYVDESSIANLLKMRGQDGIATAFLTNADGLILASPQEGAVGQTLSLEAGETLPGTEAAERLASKTLPKNDHHAIACSELEGGRLRLYTVMQEGSSADATRSAMVLTILVAAVLVCSSLLLAQQYTVRMGRDVSNILNTMDKANQGQLDVRSTVKRRDEFGAISKHLNHMLEQIEDLLHRTEEAKDRQRTAEIQALEAQINPHFMFNTLDSINWMAIENGQFEISQMLKYLSELFRYAVRSSEVVEIHTEIEHLRQYVYLQQRRYAYAFVCRIHVEKELEACHIHKLLLQPLVENALLHGFDFSETSDEKENVICISVTSEAPDMLTIRVQDNGRGMDEDLMNRLNHGEIPDRRENAIGVQNVISRMEMYYAGRGSIRFRAAPQSGLIVEFRFPMQKDTNFEGGQS